MKDLKWYWHRQNTVSWDPDNPVSGGVMHSMKVMRR
ncbi:hypothetical protein HNR54_001316 [Methanothermobacter sp. DSM 3267]